jgi:DNA-binding transcriptional MocR family regulator
MTISIDGRPGPRAAAIADALAEAIESGALRPGERLPPHRSLARSLGVSVGTVTRAYAEARARRLIVGEVGRGTFVRQASGPAVVDRSQLLLDRATEIDLGLNLTVADPARERPVIERVLAELVADGTAFERLARPWSEVEERFAAAGQRWIEACTGFRPPAASLLAATGFHVATLATLRALLSPGDLVLCEALSYPGLKRIADECGLRLLGVATDEHGILPDALRAAARARAARALYCRPTLHSVTTATLPLERRREIARVAAEQDLWIIEDDEMFAFAGERLPPLAAVAPDQTTLVADLTRVLGVGLRLCHVVAPPAVRLRLADTLHNLTWMPSPLAGELAVRLLESGAAAELVAAKLAELAARHALVAEKLGRHAPAPTPRAHQAWIPLPYGWRSEELAAAASERGVTVFPAELFAMPGAPVPRAVRASLGLVRERAELARGLERLAELIERPRRARRIWF